MIFDSKSSVRLFVGCPLMAMIGSFLGGFIAPLLGVEYSLMLALRCSVLFVLAYLVVIALVVEPGESRDREDVARDGAEERLRRHEFRFGEVESYKHDTMFNDHGSDIIFYRANVDSLEGDSDLHLLHIPVWGDPNDLMSSEDFRRVAKRWGVSRFKEVLDPPLRLGFIAASCEGSLNVGYPFYLVEKEDRVYVEFSSVGPEVELKKKIVTELSSEIHRMAGWQISG